MTVAALAGRRVDAPGARPRFPSANLLQVRASIQQELERLGVRTLVCSAACGADLLALAVAGELGIRRRAILPTGPASFRRTSVEDRPGDWGVLFDRIITEVRERDDLVTLDDRGDETQQYFRTNTRILDDAQQIAAETHAEAVAIAVWDGQSRGEPDVTDAFRREARRRGLRVIEISTFAENGG